MQKRKKKSNVAARAFAVIMVIILALGITYGALAITKKEPNPLKWFAKAEESEDGGLKLNASGALEVRTISANSLEDITAESAYELTASATFGTPPDSYSFGWTTDFENPASEWATEKTTESYISVTTSGTHNEKAVVACVEGFSEPIIITVEVNSEEISPDETHTATCRCDYTRRAAVELVGDKIQLSKDEPIKNVFKMQTVGTVGETPQNLSPELIYELYVKCNHGDIKDDYTCELLPEPVEKIVQSKKTVYSEDVGGYPIELYKSDLILQTVHCMPGCLFEDMPISPHDGAFLRIKSQEGILFDEPISIGE